LGSQNSNKKNNELMDNWLELREKQNKLRKSHYEFAHHALRYFVYENPKQFIKIMQSNNACKFLEESYNNVKSECNDEWDINIKDNDFSVHLTEIQNHYTIIITLPETIRSPEAKMLGIIFLYKKIFGEIFNTFNIRYFTLEYGESPLKEEPYNVFCEWKGLYEKSEHLNYGSGPEADIEKFKEKIAVYLNK